MPSKYIYETAFGSGDLLFSCKECLEVLVLCYFAS